MQGLPRKITLGLLMLVFVVSVIRAKTQYFTVDEAFVFHRFVDKDLSFFAKEFDACNHVLHTLLTKMFRGIFGVSELELRLSSLVGCLIYLWASWRLSLLYFGHRWMLLLSVALLTLNPLVMDFFVASRGYGLALGLLMSSIYCASVYWMCGRDLKWLWGSGVLAGLAIAANLTLLVPAAGLGIVLLLFSLQSGSAGFWRVIDRYGGPAVVTACLFVLLPLLRAEREMFYYGASRPMETIDNLVHLSFTKVVDRWPWALVERAVPVIDFVIVPGLVLAILAGLVYVGRKIVRSTGPTHYRLVPYFIVAGTLVSSVMLLWILRLFGVLYPLGRTGLYLIPLFTLAVLLGAGLITSARMSYLRHAAYVAAVVVVFVYVTQFDGRYFADWRFDAATGKLLNYIQSDFQAKWRENRQPELAASPILVHTVEYYRVRRKMWWLGSLHTDKLETAPADYYVLLREDKQLIDRLNLELMYRDRVSGALLARRRS